MERRVRIIWILDVTIFLNISLPPSKERVLISNDLIFTSFIQVKIIGVEPSDANAMALSLCHGQRIMLDKAGVFADGVAVKEVGEETFRLCKDLMDGVVLVSRDAICASIKV